MDAEHAHRAGLEPRPVDRRLVRRGARHDLDAIGRVHLGRELAQRGVEPKPVVAVEQQQRRAHAPACHAARRRATRSSSDRPDHLGKVGLERMSGSPGDLDLLGVFGMSELHVVQPLVDGHELLRHMPVGNGHQDRRPAARESVVVEQAVDGMGGDRHRELRVARRLEPERADDPVLAAGPPDLDLVDVVQQRRRLDQRAVDRDLRLRKEGGAGHGHAGDALGMDHDAVGQALLVQHAPSGGSVGNGHGPMLAADPVPCTASDALQPASVLTRYDRPSVTSSTSPSRSVRNTATPDRAANVARVSGAGCPYSLPSPTEMTATAGLVASRNAGRARRGRAVVPDLQHVHGWQ